MIAVKGRCSHSRKNRLKFVIKPHLEPLLQTRSPKKSCVNSLRNLQPRQPRRLDGAVRILDFYLRNATFMFEPWIMVWQSVQGVSSEEPALTPCTVPAATGLWHWLQSRLMFGMFNMRAFCDPCGVWQPMQPSPLTGVCSYTKGPRFSVWHLVQIRF